MATLTMTGTVVWPASSGGSNSTLIIGSPSVTSSSSTGPQLTFAEQSCNTYVITSAASPFTVPTGSLASIDFMYIGTDQAITYILNGGAETVSLAADGFSILYNAGITAISISAVAVDATVQILLAGD